MKTLIKNAQLVNEGQIFTADVLIENGRISKIDKNCNISAEGVTIIDANGKHLLPGVIDDQVHFREPGLTHKGCIKSEARAAVAAPVPPFATVVGSGELITLLVAIYHLKLLLSYLPQKSH